MTEPREVAEWMLARLDDVDYMYQSDVVFEIPERFGDGFTRVNANGGDSISEEVLSAFRKLTGDTVVWERGERLWRRRQPHDPPGRMQD
jgi:hypothetical protein